MKKKVMAMVIAISIASPCVMMFSCGPEAAYGIESLGWPNLIGVAWGLFLHFGGLRMLMPTWAYKKLQEMKKEKDDIF